MHSVNVLERIKISKTRDEYFDIKKINYYIEEFNELRDRGFFLIKDNFNSDYWTQVVGGKEFAVNFPNEMKLKKIINNLGLKISIRYLITAYKGFILKNLEFRKYIDKTINSINKLYNGIENLNNCTAYELVIISEFIKYIKIEKKKALEVEEVYNRVFFEKYQFKDDNTRTLPSFNDVFKFINIIDDIVENKGVENYSEYIPIILWWKITSIIPIRPTEFLNIRFDSIKSENNINYLNIKRSKGKSKGKINIANHSKREDYYYDEKIAISDNIFNLINKCKDIIKNEFNYSDNEFLIPHVFIRKGSAKRVLNKKLFTQMDLLNLLNKFYDEVAASEEYGFEPISRYEKSESKNSIQRLIPYDARHIAIINLVLLGTEPQTVMKLAGHSNITTTEGYYNHVMEFADCFSISVANKIVGERVKRHIYNDEDDNDENEKHGKEVLTIIKNKSFTPIKVDNGYCFYPKIKEDISICIALKVNCSSCTYFKPNNIEKLREDERKIYNEMASEAKTLRDMINYRNIFKYHEKVFISANRIRAKADELAIARANLIEAEIDKGDI